MRTERGGIVIAWLLKILVTIALLGVLTFEAGQVVFAHVTADNAARVAAKEAAQTMGEGGNERAARRDAEAAAKNEGGTLVTFTPEPPGPGGQARVVVVVEKKANTMFAHKIGFLERFTKVRARSRGFSV